MYIIYFPNLFLVLIVQCVIFQLTDGSMFRFGLDLRIKLLFYLFKFIV